MYFSMWMLYDRLREFDPVANIQCDELRISEVRVLAKEISPSQETNKVFVWLEDAGKDPYAIRGTVCLRNGDDTITLPNVADTGKVINAVLEAYSYFNRWEARLHRAVAKKDHQQVVDLATQILDNPTIMADTHFDIVGISTAFLDRDFNPAWVECREDRKLAQGVIGVPLTSPDGESAVWTSGVHPYILPDGTHIIGGRFGDGDEYQGGICTWAAVHEFLPSDVALVRYIYDAVHENMTQKDNADTLHSAQNILADMLNGNTVDSTVVRVLSMRYPGPWRLMLLYNPLYSPRESVSLNSYLLSRLESATIRNISVIYEDNVVVFAQQEEAENLLDQCVGSESMQYYIVCMSQPFSDLREITSHYDNVRFLLARVEKQPGLYCAEDYGIQYIIHTSRCLPNRMPHPALAMLKAHDREKNSTLYETLYQFLFNERSTQRTAQALHIHKNSLLYRLNQIKEIADLDLDDPNLRAYLVLSFFIDEDNRLRAEEEIGQ